MRVRVAAYAVAVDAGRVLLCRLADHVPAAGQWTLPGGGMDHGEQPLDTLRREVREETGLDVRDPELVDVVAGYGPDWQAVRILFRADVRGEPRVVEVGGSTAEAAWVALVDVPTLTTVPMVAHALAAAGYST